ncbi:hypothetical protein LXL04_023902 [Taraxacum kok-saghyz]
MILLQGTLRRRKRAVTSVDKTGKEKSCEKKCLTDVYWTSLKKWSLWFGFFRKIVAERAAVEKQVRDLQQQKEVVPEKIPNQLHHLNTMHFITLFVKLRIKNKCYGVGQRRKRGPNINKKATQVLDNLKESHSAARLTFLYNWKHFCHLV